MEREEPKNSVTIGYSKIWKTQYEGLLAKVLSALGATPDLENLDGIDSFKNGFSTLYSLTGISDIEHPLAQDVDLIETSIYEKVDAEAELARRITLRSTRRRVFKVQSLATSFTYTVGDVVHITNNRFGLNLGKLGVIVGIEESPTNKRVNLDIWV